MYIYIYIYIYVYICIFINKMYTYIYIYVLSNMCIYTCKCDQESATASNSQSILLHSTSNASLNHNTKSYLHLIAHKLID